MKRLLSLLGTVSLTATTASSVVACGNIKQNEFVEETDVSKDLKTLNTISKKIKTEFNKYLFKENILLKNDNNLSKAYNLVDASNPSLVLKFNNIEHQNFKKYLLTFFRSIFNNINQQIKNEYSNYYQNSNPMFLDIDGDIDITLNFVNIQELSKLLNINDTNNLNAIAIQFDFKYKIRFKNYESDSDFTALFNITNNLEKFNSISGGILNFFNKELIVFFRDKNQIDITMGDFKKLYDDFDIDYKKTITSIDNIYKEIFKKFIMNNQKLKEMITYNNKNFLETQTTLFNDNNDKGFYYNEKNDIAQNSFLTKWYKNAEVKAQDFVDLYMKKIVPKFDTTNSNLELGQFKINLNYINFYGMSLNRYFSMNEIDFISTIILPKNKLKKKLTNFANLIIAFLKYYKVEYKDQYYFNVPINVWKKLNDKITTNKLPEILFEEFKNDASIINQNLEDLELFNFKQLAGWLNFKIKFDIEKNMFLYNGGGTDGSFTFGSSEFIYMPFYYLWIEYRYVVVKT